MILHTFRSRAGIGATLGAYPLKHILRNAPVPSSLKHSLLRFYPRLYGYLLQTKRLFTIKK